MEIEHIPLAEKIDTLMKEVIEDAEIKAELKIRQTEEKSRKMIQDFTKTLEIEIDEMFEAVGEKIKKIRERKLLSIQSQVDNEIMLAKEEKVNKVLEILKKKLLAFKNDKRYKTHLHKWFKNMLDYLSPGEYIVFLHKDDVNNLSKTDINKINQNKELKFIIAENEFLETYGIGLKSGDGRLQVEDTLEGRFNKHRESLRSKIAALLFTD